MIQHNKIQGIFTTVRPTSPVRSTYQDLPADMDDWTCAQWVTYYNRNKASIGKARAVDIINRDSDSIGFFATSNTCKYDCNWTRFFQKEGVNTGSNIFSNIFCAASNVTETAASITAPGFLRPLLILGLIGGGLYAANKAGMFDKMKKR